MSFLTAAPIDLTALHAAVYAPDRGGVAAFVGLVRDHHQGRAVLRLDYSAYGPMAEAECARIVAETEARWRVAIALQHRVGALAIGDAATRFQSLSSGVVDVIAVGTPHDLLLRQKGFSTLAGPPEVGLPGACVFTPERYLRENPQTVRKVLKALLRAHQYIFENRQETIQTLLRWLPQTPEVASHSYDFELKTMTHDGLMTDSELDALMVRLGEKKRPLDEVRDFSLARQAMKELGVNSKE